MCQSLFKNIKGGEVDMKQRVRAIIFQNNCVLLIHRARQNRSEEYWVFPGGGVEEGENYKDALRRELLEEIGVEISIKNQFAVIEKTEDQEEVFCCCSIIGGEVGTGKGPEFKKGAGYKGLYLIEWVPFAEIPHRNILPKTVKEILIKEVKRLEGNLTKRTRSRRKKSANSIV